MQKTEVINLRSTCILSAISVLALYAALIFSLSWFLDLEIFKQEIFSKRTLFSLRLSLITATVATLLAFIVAIPAAYGLSRFNFKFKDAVETILEFPIIVSPAALGAILLIFFNNPLGKWMQDNLITFVFAFSGIVLAQFVTILGMSVRMLKAAFDAVSIELETVARTLGASPKHVFLTVTLPQAKNGLIAALILSWAKAIGEFGATLMVAGSMAMRTETLPVAIFMRLSSADLEATVALILILVCFGLAALYVVRRLLKGTPNA